MKNYILTTEHPASHYGMPILVDEETWRPIGTSDFRYTFEVSSDDGKHFLSVISYNRKRAIELLCKMEGCPVSAICFISKSNINL